MNRGPVIRLIGFLILGVALFTSSGNAGDESDVSLRDRLLATRDLFRAASTSLDEGDLERSLLLLDSIHAIDSVHPDSYYLKGKVLLMQGDSAAAIEVLNHAVRLAPRSTRVKLLLARVYLNRGSWEEPLSLTEQALLIKPSDGEALYLNAWGLLMRGDTVKALDQFEQVLESELTGNDK